MRMDVKCHQSPQPPHSPSRHTRTIVSSAMWRQRGTLQPRSHRWVRVPWTHNSTKLSKVSSTTTSERLSRQTDRNPSSRYTPGTRVWKAEPTTRVRTPRGSSKLDWRINLPPTAGGYPKAPKLYSAATLLLNPPRGVFPAPHAQVGALKVNPISFVAGPRNKIFAGRFGLVRRVIRRQPLPTAVWTPALPVPPASRSARPRAPACPNPKTAGRVGAVQ